VTWSPGTVRTPDLHVGSTATTPQPLKIEGLVTQPARGGNQFVYLCNPTGGSVSLSAYYLETDAPGTYHGTSLSLSGVLNAASTIRQDLPLPAWLASTGDALKLVYRNPGGVNASAAGRDVVVDRVEFNATRGGTLDWEPADSSSQRDPGRHGRALDDAGHRRGQRPRPSRRRGPFWCPRE